MRRWLRVLVVALVATTVVVTCAAGAWAHPLGNFTTNRYARLEVGAARLRVLYVLDEAELVAFRSRREVSTDGDAFARRRVAEIASGLALRIAGREVPLAPVVHRLSQPPGQGGLPTLRLEIVFDAPLPDRSDTLDAAFEDRNQPDRIGWREIVVRGVRGARITASTVPEEDRTRALRDYPEGSSTTPLDVREATFRFTRGRGVDPAPALSRIEDRGAAGDRFERLLTDTASSPIAVGAALMVALLFGALHALGPGHGKTVMAAYLVSTAGRRRDAVALGAVVSLMHTASVLALGVVLATVGRNLEVARVYPVLTLLAGVLVALTGADLVRRRLRTQRSGRGVHHGAHHHQPHHHEDAHDHDHGIAHDHHHHDHPHHDHPVLHPALSVAAVSAQGAGGTSVEAVRATRGPGPHVHGRHVHSHDLPPGVAPLSRRGLIALAASGGLFPSPSAIVVLVGAFALGREALGLALIAAFSLGLAGVLVAVGLVLVAGRNRLSASRFAVAVPWLPTLGACAITMLGLVLIIRGVDQLQ